MTEYILNCSDFKFYKNNLYCVIFLMIYITIISIITNVSIYHVVLFVVGSKGVIFPRKASNYKLNRNIFYKLKGM